KAALAIAPTACWVTKRFFTSTDVPLLLLTGTSDQLVPEAQNAARAYKADRAPKWLVSLKDGSHTGFVGALAALPGTPHPDSIGCAGLGGKEKGINSTPKRCALPCTKKLPESAMAPAEQQELTRIAGLAFFEGTL